MSLFSLVFALTISINKLKRYLLVYCFISDRNFRVFIGTISHIFECEVHTALYHADMGYI